MIRPAAQLKPCHVELGNRQIKSSETYVIDSGLPAHIIGADERRITEDGAIPGTMLESFVVMEQGQRRRRQTH